MGATTKEAPRAVNTGAVASKVEVPMQADRTPRLITAAQDVNAHILVLVANCVEDWFPDDRPMPTDEFIDRLCEHYGFPEGWDIEKLDTPAVRKIMRHARQTRAEMA